MAQTAGAMSNRGGIYEIATVSTGPWTNISGVFNSIKQTGGERKTGETYTADGDTAIIAEGKRAPVELACTIVYSETSTEGFTVVSGYFNNDTTVYFRWSPAGGKTNDMGYQTDKAVITQCEYPTGGAVESGDPITLAFNLKTGKITGPTSITTQWT